jgi:general secretion pathway protein K
MFAVPAPAGMAKRRAAPNQSRFPRALPSAQTQRGFALLIVLWAIVLAALIGTQVTALGRRETHIASNLRSAALVEAAADGAVYEAVFHLLSGEPDWIAGAPHHLTVGSAGVDVAVQDESGKVDLNSAQAPMLTALFSALNVEASQAQGLAAAITVWRGDQTTGPAGDPSQPYRAAGLDYGPPGEPFKSLDELALILGMTPDLFQATKPHVTLWGGGSVNPQTTDPVVAQALRQLPPDPNANAQPQPQQQPQLQNQQQENQSRAVTIDAVAAGADRASFHRRAVIQLQAGNGKSYVILTWERASP